MSKEAMQQALAVLRGCLDHPDAADAITGIEAAIAQPVQPTMAKILHLVQVLENSAAIDGRENHPSNRTEQAYEQVVFALREALAQPVRPTDSTPKLHVGNSSFEEWYQTYPRQGISKQIARDAYAAGMGDLLVTYAQSVPASPEPLSNSRIYKLKNEHPSSALAFARAIEKAHGIDSKETS